MLSRTLPPKLPRSNPGAGLRFTALARPHPVSFGVGVGLRDGRPYSALCDPSSSRSTQLTITSILRYPPRSKKRDRNTQHFTPTPCLSCFVLQPSASILRTPSQGGVFPYRSFHSTARRDALPLIPATAAILKSTSLLTAITYISRILISFFPIGLLGAFKFTRGVRWLQNTDRIPIASPEAEEFYKMWCEGEKYQRISNDLAVVFLKEGEYLPDSGLRLPDGRVAYPTPMPPRFGKSRNYASSQAVLGGDPRTMFDEYDAKTTEKLRIQYMHSRRFIMPNLPPAAVPYFEELSSGDQAAVTALRRYWLSLRIFKDTLKITRFVVSLIFGLPVLLLLGVYITALERTPLTGRWRVILLTAEEEDRISTSLAGGNWYKSVINLLTTPESPAPPVAPLSDWRWQWVQGTLRQLEAGAIRETQRLVNYPDSLPVSINGLPVPPPTGYPVKPRPRVSSMLHAALPGGEPTSGKEHLELGPPYSLMLMEKPEKNAFSYGFGGKGAGGIVVFTGLLDEILSIHPAKPEGEVEKPKSGGFLSGLFSSSQPTSNSRTGSRPRTQPTEEQTLHLAAVLAHEMGHLLLSHHLETLSQQQVLWPSVLGLTMDLVRAFIWPLTWFLGPTVNDALANMGRTSVDVMADKYGEIGFQWKHEYEADFAATRLLALAGYDPRSALAHFANSVTELHEIRPADKSDGETLTGRLFKLWEESTHPSREMRLGALSDDLAQWTYPDSGVKTNTGKE